MASDSSIPAKDSPEDLRSRARQWQADAAREAERAAELRKQARAASKLAEEARFMAEYLMKRAGAEEDAAARAAVRARPVWREEPVGVRTGRLIVADVRDGCFVLADINGTNPTAYGVRGGLRQNDCGLEGGRLDVTATMQAWRAYCAARKAEVPHGA